MQLYPLAPVRTVAPAEPPVTAADIRFQLRLEPDDNPPSDAELLALAAAATEHLDGWAGILGRAMVTQTWRQDLRCFVHDVIRLPLAPVSAVTSVTYRDADDVEQTLSTDVYGGPLADAASPFIYRKSGQSWPSVHDRPDAVAVTFVAGYGAAAAVPAPLRQAILLMVADLYENRETVVTGTIASAIPMSATVQRLIKPYRRVSL